MRRPGGFDGSVPPREQIHDSAQEQGQSFLPKQAQSPNPEKASEPKPKPESKWKLKRTQKTTQEPVSGHLIAESGYAAVAVEPIAAEPVATERSAAELSGAEPVTLETVGTAAVIPISGLVANEVDRVEAEPDGVRQAQERLKDAGRARRRREKREQRRFTEHLRARRRRWFVAGCTVLGLALFVIVGVLTPIMAVREIQVQGAQAVNVEELQTALSRFEGVPLALVSDQDVHRALEPFPLVQRYSIERIPPHTLIVRIEERSAVIALDRDGEFDLFDPAGVLLGRVAERPGGVPVGSPELTDTASPAFLAASNIVRDMPEDLRALLVGVQASNAQDVSFELSNGTQVLWGESKETQRKSVVLRSMLASVGAPELIDVSAPDAPVFK